MFDFRFGNGRVVRIDECGITATDADIPVTRDKELDRCADCGGEAHRQFSVKFEPWKYVITCKKCGQQSGFHNEAIDATTEWNRRQREKMDIKTKCAACGGTGHMKFDVLAEPWDKHYVVICEDCGECGKPSHSYLKALDDWERRQKENMESKKAHKYLVIKEGHQYKKYGISEEYFTLEDAIKKAEDEVEFSKGSSAINKDIMVVEVIAKAKTDRRLVFTDEGE